MTPTLAPTTLAPTTLAPTTTPTGNAVPASPTARRTGMSLAGLVGLEIRKSLSTRSGRSVAALAVLVAPLGVGLATLTDGGGVAAPMALGIMGMLIALVLLALGVLSTAGEWSSRSIETTYLLVPRRGRVLAAKAAAMTVLGTALATLGVALATGALAVLTDGVVWDSTGRAVAVVVAGGAAFAGIGAGIGAAVGNPAAAMTGTYLAVLGVLPVLNSVKPEISAKLDPAGSIVTMAQTGVAATPVLVIAGWLVLATVAGAIVTRRRSVA